jgi:hypothetical protein
VSGRVRATNATGGYCALVSLLTTISSALLSVISHRWPIRALILRFPRAPAARSSRDGQTGRSLRRESLMFMSFLHRLTRFGQTHWTRPVVVAATGDRLHAVTGTPLPIQPLQQRSFPLRRQAGEVGPRQLRVKGLGVRRGSARPNRLPQNETTSSQDERNADRQPDCGGATQPGQVLLGHCRLSMARDSAAGEWFSCRRSGIQDQRSNFTAMRAIGYRRPVQQGRKEKRDQSSLFARRPGRR